MLPHFVSLFYLFAVANAACIFTPHVRIEVLGAATSAALSTAVNIPLLDSNCLKLRQSLRADVLRGYPSVGVGARLANRTFVDSYGNSMDAVSLIFTLNAIYPGGIFASPFIPEIGFAELNITEAFDMVVCDIVSGNGVPYSLGGKHSRQVQFANGNEVPLLSYGCRFVENHGKTLG